MVNESASWEKIFQFFWCKSATILLNEIVADYCRFKQWIAIAQTRFIFSTGTREQYGRKVLPTVGEVLQREGRLVQNDLQEHAGTISIELFCRNLST